MAVANYETASFFVNPCRVLVEKGLHFLLEGRLKHLSRSLTNQGVQRTTEVGPTRKKQAFSVALANRNRLSILSSAGTGLVVSLSVTCRMGGVSFLAPLWGG
jgi:hypothetical protein